MSWLIPERVQKRCYTYLVQRYLGRFFEEKLDPNQLTVDLYNCKCSLKDIRLDVQAINELLAEHNSPLEIVDGSIENIDLHIPWKTLLSDSSTIDISSMRLTFQPKQRTESATSMFESMWTSMTSSLHLAEDCIKQESAPMTNTPQRYEGLEMFAETIDSILNRVKIRFLDTVVQLEYLPKGSARGVGLAIHIESINYADESANDPSKNEATDLTHIDDEKAYLEQSYSAKSVRCEGVSLHTIEFSHKTRIISDTNIDQYESMADLANDENDQYDYYKSNNDRSIIKFGEINGKLEVTVRCKRTEDLDGPKFSINIDVGAFLLFFSPRQLHLLIELIDGFSNPDIEDTKYVGKPMTQDDYEKIEKDIQQQMLSSPMGKYRLQGLNQGWTNEGNDFEDDFHPLRNRSGMYESAMSATSTMESSMSSSVTSAGTETTSRSRRRVNKIDVDPTADIIHFDIHINSLYLILLHEDILVESSNMKYALNNGSVKQMEMVVNSFFSESNSIFGARHFRDANCAIDTCCKRNHLRLLAAPLHIEGDQKKTRSVFSISGHLEASKFELNEFLYDKEANTEQLVPLITFAELKLDSPQHTAKTSLKLIFKHIERTSKSDLAKTGPKTDLLFQLSHCTLQFDITILDRISTLLNPQPICVVNKPYNPWGGSPAPPVAKVDVKLDIKVTSPHLSLILRFPKLDFRPLHINKVSWWQRNLHPDFLTLDLITVVIQIPIQSKQPSQDYTIVARKIAISYSENANSAPIKIAKAGHEDIPLSSIQAVVDECKFSLRIFEKKNELHEPTVDVPLASMTQSIGGILVKNHDCDNGPFSSKRIIHESDTPHHRNQADHKSTPELLVPGEKPEIDAFIQSSLSTSLIQIDITLPTISMQLISKHIYEVIYNRISNDLLLWSPQSTKLHPQPPSYDKLNASLAHPDDDIFTLCKTAIALDSESESDDDKFESNVFHSTYAPKTKCETNLTINLKIGAGVLCIFAPSRDSSTNVIPGQHGEFLVEVGGASVFFVSGYNGSPELGYLCAQLQRASLHHCELTSAANPPPPLRDLGLQPGGHLHPTIYGSEAGAQRAMKRGGNREMVTLCIKLQAGHETHHAKNVSVAVAFNCITLRHRMCTEPNSWITQLIDFFNVQDYPIAGYQPKDVLTELFCHVWDSAIDYRPIKLPIRSIITVGGFSISSHLSAEINTSTLRFIAEDCALYLSQKVGEMVDLKRDYVRVIEMGVFEISLKTADRKNVDIPHFDLRTSNDLIRVRTCADSARALFQLIKYFADDGDLRTEESELSSSGSAYASPKHEPHEELVSLVTQPQEIANVSEKRKEHMNELIKDAMEDVEIANERPKARCDLYSYNGAKVFYFPGEKQASALQQVTEDLGEVAFEDDDFEREFCFIDQELGYNVFPKNGDPVIKWLNEGPVRIVDNHFAVPSEKVDPLRTPKNFPTPTMQYTLCEMTIVWHMYGGCDFSRALKENDEGKKRVNFSDLRVQNKVTYSHRDSKVVLEKEKPKTTKRGGGGGAERDSNVLMEIQLNKIRFRHEVYPEQSAKASRQVLLVSEFEIRDRLLNSEYNKFLYQYTSQDRPKRSNADMIVIKMLHVRPDPKLRTQECGLKVSLLPLWFNIDQDALQFLIGFFSALGADSSDEEGVALSSKSNTPIHQPPIMTVSEDDEELQIEEAKRMLDENLLILEENIETNLIEEPTKSCYVTPEDSPIYFRKVSFLPDVPIRLDYRGKGVDLTRGPIHGLVMGLTQLNRSEVRLKRIVHRHGLLGFDKLLAYLLKEWINDIKKNQIPSLLSGVGPVYSLVQLIQGIRDLFYLPFEQYKKDGRFLRGLHRGANSFTASTAMAALELTTRLIHLIQITAETAFDMLTPGPSVSYNPKTKKRRKRYSQPKDIREGVTNAYKVVKEGFGETADNIRQVATHEHEQKGVSGAVGGVIRQIPQAIIKPLIIATEATNNVLGGIRCQYVTDARKEADEKWRND